MGKFWEASIEASSRMLPPDSHFNSTMVAVSSVHMVSVVYPTTKVFDLAVAIGIDEDGIIGATKADTAEPAEKSVTQISWKDFIFLLYRMLVAVLLLLFFTSSSSFCKMRCSFGRGSRSLVSFWFLIYCLHRNKGRLSSASGASSFSTSTLSKQNTD
jgi:hypothetical protein